MLVRKKYPGRSGSASEPVSLSLLPVKLGTNCVCPPRCPKACLLFSEPLAMIQTPDFPPFGGGHLSASTVGLPPSFQVGEPIGQLGKHILPHCTISLMSLVGTCASAVSFSGLESNDLLLLWFLQERRVCPPPHPQLSKKPNSSSRR